MAAQQALCPKGGDHEWKTEDGKRFCEKCFEPGQESAADSAGKRKAKPKSEPKANGKLSAIDAAAKVLTEAGEPIWSGGMPLLGYDVDPRTHMLVVNEAEAQQVRAIFELYLEKESLLSTAEELARRGWVSKRWTTRKGDTRGGQPFGKGRLHKLLTNVVYLGKSATSRRFMRESRRLSSAPRFGSGSRRS